MAHSTSLLRRKATALFSGKIIHCIMVLLLVGAVPATLRAQALLEKTISLEVRAQPLHDVLEIISNQGNFYFSYNSNIINRDSLVTISVYGRTVRQVLDILFRGNYMYIVSGNYVILRRAPLQLPLITSKAGTSESLYEITGYVLNEETGERIHNASVYEKQQLASALTNDKGFFRLKLKSRYHTASLTVSKEFYDDTTVTVQPNFNQQLNILISPLDIDGVPVTIAPTGYKAPDSIVVLVPEADYVNRYIYRRTDSGKVVERTALGRLFLSSSQKIQSINLRRFFATRTYQMSLVPGLSTQGKLSSQVINHVSISMVGGYTGGVNGVEIAGAFNINRKSARYVQLAGVTNVVGGAFKGIQMSGVSNTVLDSVRGLQATGITNVVKGSFRGWQLSGMFNHIVKDGAGLQAAGIANIALENMTGVQLSGDVNVAGKNMYGLQAGTLNYARNISGVQFGTVNISKKVQGLQLATLNFARVLKGAQIGIVNIADSSEGFSFGLINIVVKGYHKLSVSANELTNFNAAFRSGNKNFYSIIMAGMNPGSGSKIYTFGYGIGSEITLNKQLLMNPEISSEAVYLGNWDQLSSMQKIHLNFQWRFGKYLSIFAGPSFAAYYDVHHRSASGYKAVLPNEGYHHFSLWNRDWAGWIGWNAGVNIF